MPAPVIRTNFFDGGAAALPGNITAADLNAMASAINSLTIVAQPVPAKLLTIGDAGFGTGIAGQSTAAAGTTEDYYTVGFAASGLAAEFQHFYTSNPGFADTLPAGAIVFNASLRVVSTSSPGLSAGSIYRLTFGGRTTATLDPGGRIISDLLALPVVTGDVIAIRAFLSSGTAWPNRSIFGEHGGFTATTDLTAPGSGAVGAAFGYSWGSANLLGYPKPGSSPLSVLIVGDSISRGFGDGNGALSGRYPDNEALSGGGYFLRALSGKAGVMNIGVAGDTALLDHVGGDSMLRDANAFRCTSAIIEYGINDFSGGQTALQVETNMITIAQTLQPFGIGVIYVVTITPSTTSTDGWITTANQTKFSGDAQRVTYNTWVRAGCPLNASTLAPVAVGTSGALLAGQLGHPITGFFEVADTVESARNSGLWKTPAGRTLTDAVWTSGADTITSASAAFGSSTFELGGDLGSTFVVAGAGASGAALGAYIWIVNSATQITTPFINAATSVTGAHFYFNPFTLDGTHPSTYAHYLAAQAINVNLL